VQSLLLSHIHSNASGTILANQFDHCSDGGEWMPLLSASELERSKGERRMDCLKVSAMFAAYVWFTEINGEQTRPRRKP
jgi:hypothetical protein